ncbi:MAG: glyoxalase [Clostridia bacterium]|nr:glyoxalase [Clostridia bacterium]
MRYMGTLIAVKDIERSRQFYSRVLGLEVVADFGANVTLTGGVFLQTADTWRQFIHKRERDILFANHAMELYFESEDMDAFLARLAALPDIAYLHPPLTHSWGQRAVRFYDPDCHIVEVGESMDAVIAGFLSGGLSVQETALRMDVPVDYVRSRLGV